jgi:hypothetical protein
MTVNISPLRSQAGFQSPGFLVSPTGDITIDGNFISSQLVVNGITILETEDSTVSLGTDIKNSSLTNLGVLNILEVGGDVSIVDISDNTNISIVDGQITISSVAKGSLDNIAIGQTSAAEAAFTDIDADNLTLTTAATIPTLTTTTASITTLTATDITSTDISVDDIEITNQPTELNHATRKDYVDNRISALSIALGA